MPSTDTPDLKINPLPQVKYDRSLKSWVVALDPDDESTWAIFPAGKDGEWMARFEAIHYADIDLWSIAQERYDAHKYLLSRLIFAAEIVIGNGVRGTLGHGEVCEVAKSDGGGWYRLIKVEQGIVLCPCTDHERRAPYIVGSFQKHCKHVLAWQLHEALQAILFDA